MPHTRNHDVNGEGKWSCGDSSCTGTKWSCATDTRESMKRLKGKQEGCEVETMAKVKIRFPLRTQIPEGTGSVGLGLNVLDIVLKRRQG